MPREVCTEEDVVLIEEVSLDEWGQENQVGEIEEGNKSLSDQEEGELNDKVGKDKDYMSEGGTSGAKSRDGTNGLSTTRSTKQDFQRYGTSPFRFQQMWVEHQDIFPLVKTSWEEEGRGRGLENLAFKLKHNKHVLKTWNKEKFGHVEIMIRELEQSFEVLDSHLQEGYEEMVEQDLLITKIELDIWKKRKESMLEQKAKAKWIREGDNNTRFFHSILKRRQQTQVNEMLKADDTSFESLEAVYKGAVQYFQRLLDLKCEGGLLDLSLFVDNVITEGENKEITKCPIVKDIRQALFSIPVESSLGPDGFGSSFFRNC
ncbi:hypothetical protein F2P56_003666 [Juglans regia]|uniref:Uncharacterized protein LOC108985867 n=2 Tax=Juglans regia TaxID=51240 RepID=A0A2I4E397_JUGRE|nr:uncharacterized protein LOC108985867 [Juglans regia]KAF5476984.1 hypothetical protein F2P56_003666 [Juglans regia]